MRDVLVAVGGLTPQVVTETLWALHHRTPPIHPAEVWILTTQAGRKACLEKLLRANRALARFIREYRPKPMPRCQASHVIILKGADGKPLDDVRSERDNQAIADQLAEFIRKQVERSDVRLHCSVAGGRKTMGVLLASALQLFGRAEDRLYHVLVSPEFESIEEFFFPPRRPRWLTDKNGRRLLTSQASIELAELPYVRLRGLMAQAPPIAATSFGKLVTLANQRLSLWHDPDPLYLDGRAKRIWIGNRPLPLTPAMMTLYRALIRTKLDHCSRPDLRTCGDCTDCYVPFTKVTWDTSKALLEERGAGTLLPKAKGPDDAPEQFRSLVSKLNKKLDDAIGLTGSPNPYRVRSAGPKKDTVYGLALDKTKLRVGTRTDGE
ncbi:MAG TPA: CRISPR-associated ring nuclease Csm6 [Nitrospiraceae bacterium]|jgi:CRISPR-associated protein (TIGR02584 family)|nr:CRISPR-associated ring nuclease Csm6 [Nitrospiraceae bacterium]